MYPKGTNRRLPEAAGFVTQRGALPITAATAVSKKWPRQAFGSRAVVRAYVGGAGLEHELDRADDDILSSARDAVATVYRLTVEPEHAALSFVEHRGIDLFAGFTGGPGEGVVQERAA